jgi:WASH complex subunit strumpellin
MFAHLARIIDLQTKRIREVPTRLEKEKMKEYAQLEERFEVSGKIFYVRCIIRPTEMSI